MSALGQKQTLNHFHPMAALSPKADIDHDDGNVRFVPKADVLRCSGNGRKGPVGHLRRGPPVREAWSNRGRVLRRLGEPNGRQDYGSHQLAAVPQSVLHGGSPKSRDPLLVFRAAYRSDTHARQATFGRLRIPLVLSIVRSSDGAHGCQMQICRGYPGCGNPSGGLPMSTGGVLCASI